MTEIPTEYVFDSASTPQMKNTNVRCNFVDERCNNIVRIAAYFSIDINLYIITKPD